jgi:hypothetical protein
LGYLAEEVGYPFDHIPLGAFTSFAGGVEGWASMCGALVPAIAAIGMVAEGDDKKAMINELMAFYVNHPFPEYQTGEYDLPKVAINSTICHVSVTKWMTESGMGPRSSKERSARCAGVTADVCKFTAEMLNNYFDGKFTAGVFAPASVAKDCLGCHQENVEPYSFGKEDCTECHDDLQGDIHSKFLKNE